MFTGEKGHLRGSFIAATEKRSQGIARQGGLGPVYLCVEMGLIAWVLMRSDGGLRGGLMHEQCVSAKGESDPNP